MHSTYKTACLYVRNDLCITECILVNYDFTLTAINWQIKIWLTQDQYNEHNLHTFLSTSWAIFDKHLLQQGMQCIKVAEKN